MKDKVTTIKTTEKSLEDFSVCKHCRYFHRYMVRSVSRPCWPKEPDVSSATTDIPNIEIENQIRILSRCLVGTAFSPPLEENVVVNCNQFERCKAKKKL